MVPKWDRVGFPRVEIFERVEKRHRRRSVDLGILTVVCKNQTIERKKDKKSTLVTTIINKKNKEHGYYNNRNDHDDPVIFTKSNLSSAL